MRCAVAPQKTQIKLRYLTLSVANNIKYIRIRMNIRTHTHRNTPFISNLRSYYISDAFSYSAHLSSRFTVISNGSYLFIYRFFIA